MIHPKTKYQKCFDVLELNDIFDLIIGEGGIDYLQTYRNQIKKRASYEYEELITNIKKWIKELEAR
jgi:hypothetical protein